MSLKRSFRTRPVATATRHGRHLASGHETVDRVDAPHRPPDDIVGTLRAAGCVFAEDEARLLISAARTTAELDAMVGRRVAGLPLEQVVGWAEFCGLRIAVGCGVFVPRRRTELLVNEAASLALATWGRRDRSPTPPAIVIVDLCCGSGAVAAAFVAALGRAEVSAVEVYAVDIDPAAVACARHNLAAAAGRVYHGDLHEPLPATLRGRVDILVANVPYVPTDQIELLPAEARLYEARVALDGGTDGLDVLRRVAQVAPDWLAAGGHVFFETSEAQAPLAVEAISGVGLIPRVISSPESGATVVIGIRPALQDR